MGLLPKGRKLKNFLIYPKFQLTLVSINLIIMTICYVLVFYQVYDSFQHLIQIGLKLRIPRNSAFFELLDHHQDLIKDKLIVAAIVSYVFSFSLTIMISHRVSGPLYRLKTYFQTLGDEGYKRDLGFRDGDFYAELPDVINRGLHRAMDDAAKKES